MSVLFYGFIILFLIIFIFFSYVFYLTDIWRMCDAERIVEQEKQTKHTEI